MARYSGTVTLIVGDYEAKDNVDASQKLNDYIDHLVSLLEENAGELRWHSVDYAVDEERP